MRQASKDRFLLGRESVSGPLACQYFRAMMSRHCGYFLLISLEHYHGAYTAGKELAEAIKHMK